MPWSLEIHHIYVGGAGDSTLIRARHPAVGANGPEDRTVLIDGGRAAGGTSVHNYLNSLVPQPLAINVIAVTHFDEDHYYGIIKLLNRPAPTTRYNNAIIYDCGQLPAARLTNMRQNQYGVNVPRPSQYRAYRDACVARARTHATRTVNSFDIARYDVNDAPQLPPPAAGVRPPTWLLGKDIMWGNGAVAWAENPPAWYPGAPTLRCVVANKWVRQAGVPAPAPLFISDLDIYNGPFRMANALIADYENDKVQDNAKSLGFLLEFNNFRYYVAGDLERAQEDGSQTVRAAPPAFYPGVKAFVNPAGTAAGRVLGMKTSHHGAATSSSRPFLTALRPSAAFISNGTRNKFRHPFRQTINSLDGYPEFPGNANLLNVHGGAPPPPPVPPIANYLTGYQVPGGVPVTLGGVVSQTAGPPGNHVRLDVTEAQSQRDQRGQVYRGVVAALTQFSATAGLGLTAVQIDAIADLAVTQGAVGACGLVVGTTVARCYAGTSKALEAGNTLTAAGAVVPGLVSAGVAAAAGGLAAATAAIAAVGPGKAIVAGPGTTAVLSQVVTAAPAANIAAAGLAAVPPANPNGVNAAAWAATTVSAALNVTAGGYAAMAAMGAGVAGATVGQGTVIGAVVGAQAGAANAALTVNVVRAAAIAAGVGANNASVAALAAGVAGHGGTPASVQAATLAALNAHGGIAPGAAVAAAALAQANATVPDNTLFSVSFLAAGVAQNINHSG